MARTNRTKDRTADLGFEVKLWAAADALSGSVGADDHLRVVHGLAFPMCGRGAFRANQDEPDLQRGQEADLRAEFAYANPPFERHPWHCELGIGNLRSITGTRSSGRWRLRNEQRIASNYP